MHFVTIGEIDDHVQNTYRDRKLANTTIMFVLLMRSYDTIYLDRVIVDAVFVVLRLFFYWVPGSLCQNWRSWAPTIETQHM